MGTTDKIEELIVLFDGVCNLCNASVNFIIDHNSKKNIRFAPLQSAYAREHLDFQSIIPDSIVLLVTDKIYYKSSAVLRISKYLDFPFSILYYLIILPGWMRDPVYDWIAAKRYIWFGKKEACRIPTPELKDRFIESPILS